MTDSTRSGAPVEGALRTTWLVAAIIAGPTLIVASLADDLGSLSYENANPWAGPLSAVACVVSIACGLGAFAIAAPWWSALLVASPGITWLATNLSQDVLWAVATMVSPLAALGGAISGYVIATRNAQPAPVEE